MTKSNLKEVCLILLEQGDISHVQSYAVFTLQVVANATESNTKKLCWFFPFLPCLFCASCIRRSLLSNGTCDQVVLFAVVTTSLYYHYIYI